MVEAVSNDNFESEVIKSQKPVLVDFWAEWCVPCKKVNTVLEGIFQKFSDKFKLVKLNIEESPEIASKYMVMSLPALILFKDGKPQKKLVGLISEREIEKMLLPYM